MIIGHCCKSCLNYICADQSTDKDEFIFYLMDLKKSSYISFGRSCINRSISEVFPKVTLTNFSQMSGFSIELLLLQLSSVFEFRNTHRTISITFFIGFMWLYLWKDSIAVIFSATRGVIWKKLFLQISQHSQQNTCAEVSF